MLRLILGCVADSWLRGKKGVKEGTSSLKQKQYDDLVRSVPHIYGETFMEVLPGGWTDLVRHPSVSDFKQKLWRQGCERLRKAVEFWSHDRYEHTFLGLFVRGFAHIQYEEFKDFFPGGMSEGLARSVQRLPELYQNAQRPSQDATPDDPSLEHALVTLVDDFVEYLSLVQFWPFFVQSVRYFQNQHAQIPLVMTLSGCFLFQSRPA